MTYQQTIEFLYKSFPVFQNIGGDAYKPGLGNIEALEERLSNPHRKFKSVHIAGTNGKGSTSHMIASVLTKAGYRTGLFTSPHLRDFRERIRIDGEMISEEEVVAFTKNNLEAFEQIKPSFFEITSAMAFDHFARHGVDIAVIETGMGGRLDSTNIIRPLVSVITNISFDHAEFLGDTLEKIAGEKAGIIKELTPVVIGESDIETKLTFIARAKELSAPIIFADQCYSVISQEQTPDGQHFEVQNLLDGNRFGIDCDLQGEYQRKNLLTALSALDILNGAGGIALSRETVENGIASAARSTNLMGRWQYISRSPLIVCDTGHNEAGIAEISLQLSHQKYNKLYMVIGFVREKDLSKVLPKLPKDAYYIFTQPSVERALLSERLSIEAAKYSLHGEVAHSVSEAVATAKKLCGSGDMIFVGGSTFVVADLMNTI